MATVDVMQNGSCEKMDASMNHNGTDQHNGVDESKGANIQATSARLLTRYASSMNFVLSR